MARVRLSPRIFSSARQVSTDRRVAAQVACSSTAGHDYQIAIDRLAEQSGVAA
jgi:hypothetical protein